MAVSAGDISPVPQVMSAQPGAAQPLVNGVPGSPRRVEAETAAEGSGPSLSGGSDQPQYVTEVVAEGEKGDGDANGAPGLSSTQAAATMNEDVPMGSRTAASGMTGDPGLQARADTSDQVGPRREMSAGFQNAQVDAELPGDATQDGVRGPNWSLARLGDALGRNVQGASCTMAAEPTAITAETEIADGPYPRHASWANCGYGSYWCGRSLENRYSKLKRRISDFRISSIVLAAIRRYLKAIATRDYLKAIATKDYPKAIATKDYPKAIAAKDYPKAIAARDYLGAIAIQDYRRVIIAREYVKEIAIGDYFRVMVSEIIYLKTNPWRDPLGALWEELTSGRTGQGSAIRSQGPIQIDQAATSGTDAASTNAILEALTRNLAGLQALQEKTLKKDLDADESPEQVKSTTVALPILPSPEGSAMGILLQDWLAQVAVPMQDLSASSGTWWSQVLELVQTTYAAWLASSPLERLQMEPKDHGALTTGRWTRVNARACSLILQSLPETVKLDLIARRVVQSSPLVLFRLHTTYQPGGASERSTVLGNLQNAVQFETIDECLADVARYQQHLQAEIEALIAARTQEEWDGSSPVVVNLAGGESVSLRMNQAGTILDENLESLKANTTATRRRVKAAALSMERSWFDYLLSYVDGEMASEALKAVESAPFLQEVPRQCKAGLVEPFPEANGWSALKGLEHLNRRTRKRLWSSDKWLVHLFSGKKERKDLHHLEAHGYTILELDIERGRTHDLLKTATWRAIEFGARKGKIAGIIGGPPQSSFMISRHVVGGPEPVHSNAAMYGNWPGQSHADAWLADRETQLLTRMIYLHALATAGRMRASSSPDAVKNVAFMLEHPRDPRGYLKYQDPLYNDVVSFWRTPLWTEYALEAGFNSYHFDMAAFGKAFTRHTTIGTNLPLKHLNGLRAKWRSDDQAPERSPPSVWTSEFYEQVVLALRTWGAVPKMIRMSADQWREHVRRGHLPFRSDCAVCVQAGATGRRHARIEHPSAYALSADLAGPVKIGGVDPDGRGAFPKQFKYIFVAKLKVPRTFVEDGRGVWVEYDDGELAPDKYDEVDDGLEVEPKPAKEAIRPEGLDDDADPDHTEGPAAKRDPEDDLDLAAPELVNLIFTAALKDDKAPTVLEAIQDVVLYCQSLNIPVLRFHSDRGMEFQARASKQWLKNQGIRVTSSEAGAHQTNGSAEATVRWAKQRVRALLLSAKLPQKLWPMALTTAATMQRADVLGFEPLLAAPFGAKVMVKKRQLEGPKLDDLAPKWLQGTYVGRSESLRRGHLVYVSDEDGEKFVHTLHVRSALHDPGPVEEEFVAEEPTGPSVRVRGKSSGSGDVVGVAKAIVLDEAEYQARAETVLQVWSQEEAEVIVKQMASSLPPSECVYGMFRYGGKTGVTKATIERPWFAKLLLKLLLDKAPDAEFAALFVSVRNDKEVHIDRNNAMGTLNYLLPLIMPRRGGDIWQELRDGDVVQGRVSELETPEGKKRYGCTYPLQEGRVFQLNPHRRHAVLPWTGERLVVVGYTPGMLQNLTAQDRERLWDLGFPMPLFDEMTGTIVNINALSIRSVAYGPKVFDEDESDVRVDVGSVEEQPTKELDGSSTQAAPECEVWDQWDMRLALNSEGSTATMEHPDDEQLACLRKAEVVFTENVEAILEGLEGPLSVVYTENPREVALNFEAWVPALQKEISSLSHAVERVLANDEQVQREVSSGEAQLIPMKIVFTVKPPDAAAPGQAPSSFCKRKCRIVICGNLASHQPGEVYTNTAPAEVVRAALAIARLARVRKWNLGILDVIAAFLQTPFAELHGAPLVYGVPPKLLVRAGLCQSGELWKLTHAVYGLQESPRLWGRYRDMQLAKIQIIFEGKRVTLLQGRVEPSWWSVLQDGSVLIGIIVVYVDDILICGHTAIIKEVEQCGRRMSFSWFRTA
ncbi:TY5A [Symbiodinium sp. CCMP2592]|nr:TY5A [Symbiodinium sp. CCMP2592]